MDDIRASKAGSTASAAKADARARADDKEIEYLQSVLKIPSVGARGVNAIYEHLKKEGKAYNNKTKTGFTLTKIKEWYNTRERAQTHKRDSGYHSFTPEKPKQQFQIDLIMLPKPWRNNRYKYAMVCIDTFSKKADMEPMKDKEAKTCNAAIEKVFNRLGIPKSIYCDEGSEFTNKSFLQILEKHKIEIIYATNHAPFVESFNRTIKRMLTNYMEANEISSWAAVYRDVLNAYNNTKHSTTKFAPNDIKTEDIETVRKNIKSRGRSKNYDNITDGDTVRLALKEKTFRKESDPTYSQELHKVESNNHNGLYMVDGQLKSRKDLQLIKGQVTATKKKTAQQVKEDMIGKAAYSHELKDLTGSRPTLEKTEQVINEPAMKSRGIKMDYAKLADKNYRTPAPEPKPKKKRGAGPAAQTK